LRILGIDPGSFITGYGVVDQADGRLEEVEFGSVRPPRHLSLLPRLNAIHESLTDLLARLEPQEVAVENPFLHRSVKSLLQLGQARAAALLPAAKAGLPIFEYSPREVKLAVVGYGQAEKPQVARMVAVFLRRASPPSSFDAADALAVAICHAHRAHGSARLQKSLK
jgi:crossover junction endodeoxyribonuclease RuvC